MYAGAPMTHLLDFNPTSHGSTLLGHYRTSATLGSLKVTETGKPKVDEATLSEMRDTALSARQ